MKNVIIISFDLIRECDINDSFAISYITSYLKSLSEYGKEFAVTKKSINLYSKKPDLTDEFFESVLPSGELKDYDSVAVSAYLWNEFLINPFLSYLRRNNYTNKIIMGGYQITFQGKEELRERYPHCDIFISGYAEKSMTEAIKMRKPYTRFLLPSIKLFGAPLT